MSNPREFAEKLWSKSVEYIEEKLAARDAELKQDLKDQLGWMEQAEVEKFVAEKVTQALLAESERTHDLRFPSQHHHCDISWPECERLAVLRAAAGKGELK